jgi:hypothetical protein
MTALLFVIAGVGSCAKPPPARVAELGSEARANEVAAYAHRRKGWFSVTGRVRSMGMAQGRRVVVKHSYWGGSSTGHFEEVPTPWVELVDEDPRSTDAVRCYFDPEAVDQLAQLRSGEVVVARGALHGYGHEPDGMRVIMNGCRLDR